MNEAKETSVDVQAYLKKIRQSIAASESVVQQAEARLQETDRLLESQGLTREQVLAMQFTDEQIAAANAELARRGLRTLDAAEARTEAHHAPLTAEEKSGAEQVRKLRRLMHPIRI